jgi:hypothetical protein
MEAQVLRHDLARNAQARADAPFRGDRRIEPNLESAPWNVRIDPPESW